MFRGISTLFFFVCAPMLAYADLPVAGDQLYSTYCSACHPLEPPPVLAPPLRGVIRNYYERHKEREKFVSAIRKFVLEPENGDVICVPAKERFGSMPKLAVTGDQVEKVAEWMWDNKSLWPMRYR